MKAPAPARVRLDGRNGVALLFQPSWWRLEFRESRELGAGLVEIDLFTNLVSVTDLDSLPT